MFSASAKTGLTPLSAPLIPYGASLIKRSFRLEPSYRRRVSRPILAALMDHRARVEDCVSLSRPVRQAEVRYN